MNITDRLRADLITAMRERDKLRVTTVRALIAAIDNAGAVEIERQGFDYDPKIGLNHDVDRREVTIDDIQRIIVSERDDLIAARDEYRFLGNNDRADELEHRAEIVATYLA